MTGRPFARRVADNRPPRAPLLRGADAAMHRAAAVATRRAARSRIAAAGSSRIVTPSAPVDEQHPSFDAGVAQSLKESERTLIWVADSINGQRLPDLPHDKRLQLAAGCLHMAIEHGQSIVVLTQEKCFGSALALQRPLFEAFSRGLWLRYAATDKEIDRAGRDKFPSNSTIVKALTSRVATNFSYLTAETWSTLCSYTHTGFQQIGARLSSDGLRSNYRLDEVQQALRSSDMIQLASAAELAVAAGNERLWRRTFSDRIKTCARLAHKVTATARGGKTADQREICDIRFSELQNELSRYDSRK